MRRSLIIFIVVAGSLIALIFYLSYNSSSQYSWDEHYYFKSKDPYGTLFIRKLLKDYSEPGKFTILKTDFSEEFDTNAAVCDFNYIFIGDEFYTTYEERNILLRCIEKGATALISANVFNTNDWEDLACCESVSYRDTSVELSFIDPLPNTSDHYAVEYTYKDKLADNTWRYFNIADTCIIRHRFTELGYVNSRHALNFISINYGKGQLLMHSSPIAFTNIQLQKEQIKEYAEIVLSHLPVSDIYWDEYHKISRTSHFDDQKLSGPLQYILSQTPLRWAWYLLIIASIIYVLFKSKRKQKIIPIIPEKQNTSLEFVKTIGKLYQMEGDHRKIVQRKMNLFLTFIRDRFNISTAIIDDQLIDRVSLKSGIDRSRVQGIFDHYFKIIKSQTISDKTLISFDTLMQQFYNDLKN